MDMAAVTAQSWLIANWGGFLHRSAWTDEGGASILERV
jgi:hypothetical protein